MTVTLKHTQTETHAVYMETCGNLITVAACPLIDDCRDGDTPKASVRTTTRKQKKRREHIAAIARSMGD